MGEGYETQVEAAGGYLVARSFRDRFCREWFDPAFWGDSAEPVATGGRGSAWFVSSGPDQLVLRHFCRGGLPGRFIRRDYIYTGTDAVRSFAEFRLLDKLFQDGFPVPEPIAADFRRRGLLFYRAALIVRRIPGASPLSEFTGSDCVRTWWDAGVCVRHFHEAGVFHADLNCTNILVADQIYLIDFDRGRILPSDHDDRWKAANISRLERSVKKLLASLDASLRDRLWQGFLAGYNLNWQHN